MKKWLVLPFVLLILTGCETPKSPYSIYTFKNIDSVVMDEYQTFIELGVNDITSLMNSGSKFALLIYSNSCSYCEAAKETITSYVSKRNYLIYSYEYIAQSYATLATRFPKVFPSHISTPLLYLIDGNSLTYSFDVEPTLSYSKFRPIADQHFISSNIQIFTELDSFEYLLEVERADFLFIYDDFSEESLTIFNNLIYPLAKKEESKYVTILDKNMLKTGVFSSICDYFEIGQEEINLAIYKNKNGTVSSTLYLQDNGLELSTLFNSYLSQ